MRFFYLVARSRENYDSPLAASSLFFARLLFSLLREIASPFSTDEQQQPNNPFQINRRFLRLREIRSSPEDPLFFNDSSVLSESFEESQRLLARGSFRDTPRRSQHSSRGMKGTRRGAREEAGSNRFAGRAGKKGPEEITLLRRDPRSVHDGNATSCSQRWHETSAKTKSLLSAGVEEKGGSA